MASKLALFCLLFIALSLTEANPGAGQLWKWKTKMPMVTPNPLGRPYRHVMRKDKPAPVLPKFPKFDLRPKAVPGCGVNFVGTETGSRIVGGTEATPHSYPWMAALFFSAGWFCGGSLINEEWIMTAAHCVDGGVSVDAVLGAHNLDINEPTQLTLTSSDMFTHEDWHPILIQNDIALIHLPVSVAFNDYINPVCLPAKSDGELPAGTIVNPSGWGKVSDSSDTISPTLNDVFVPTISVARCELYYGSTVTSKNICIDSSGGKGVCNGDSGGPMNYNTEGTTKTRGIASFVSSSGCESGIPHAFTSVYYFLDWIGSHTGIPIDP